MPDEMDATSVGRQVPSDLAGALGAKIERHHVTNISQVVLHVKQDSSRLCRDYTICLIKPQNLVHAAHVEDHLVKDRVGAADKARVATLGYNCDLLLVAIFKNLSDLFVALGLQHQFGLSLVLFGPILIVWLNHRWVSDHRCDLLKEADVFVPQDLELGVSCDG